jgi:hypothetical protein
LRKTLKQQICEIHWWKETCADVYDGTPPKKEECERIDGEKSADCLLVFEFMK